MKLLRTAWGFLVRDFLMAVSYRTAFALDIIWISVVVPVLFLLSNVFSGAAAPTLSQYGGHYFPFLLIGVAFQDYVTFSQTNFNHSIREHQLMGTLEIVMLSPTPVPLVLLCSSLWGFIYTSIRFWIYVLMGVIFGLDIDHLNLLSLVLITGLSVLSFSAVGIFTASLVVLIKRGAEGVTQILTVVTVALSGVLYPVKSLPIWLQKTAQFLPFTHALDGMRKAILTGATLTELAPQLTALTIFAMILFPLGLYSFSLAVERSKVTGTLGQY